MSLSSETPRAQIRLMKTIARRVDGEGLPVSERYAGQSSFVDLTPFLGEGGSVRTSKSIHEAAGGFSIHFSDKPYRMESLYGLIEPMDVIEIRIGRGGGPELPVIMRGFVTEIRRSIGVDAEGRPSRHVTISGQDYGKIWQMLQVLTLPRQLLGESLLTSFRLYQIFGIGLENAKPSGEFIAEMIEKVLNKHLEAMLPQYPWLPRRITPDISVQNGTVSVHVDQQDSSIYEIMKTHGDVGIWNELFIEDRDNGVFAVYRPTPALSVLPDARGVRKIQETAPDPIYVDFPDSSILNLEMGRSDANVSNFYWVRSPRFELVSDTHRLQYGVRQGNVLLRDYPNAAERYYGPRAMYGATQQGGDAVLSHQSGLDAAGHNRRTIAMSDWIDDRRRIMVEMNKDNVILESGTMRTKGGMKRPDGTVARAGDYARLRLGGFKADYYITKIDHDFTPFQGYFSSFQLERGEGFVERVRLEDGREAPYLLELATRRTI